MYIREIAKKIDSHLNNPEVILLFGARQTGKSTLLEMLAEKHKAFKIINCEHPSNYQILTSLDMPGIEALFDNSKIIAFDEAQVIPEIGKILKLIFDDKRFSVKLIATGSSSFDLSNKTGEPLTGRNFSFSLYPLSLREIYETNGWQFVLENLSRLLIYGSYPGVIDLPLKEKRMKLLSLTGDYLFKDIFKFENLRNPDVLLRLLKALALQIGNLVSYSELATLLGISKETVMRYIELLEKSFIIFRLGSFNRNLRNELKKRQKIYFYDTGIRNAVLNNFAAPDERNDMGAIWENYCISEIKKIIDYRERFSNTYFWRTYDGAEIDLVEEVDGKITAYEFKWNPKRKPSIPKSFSEKYDINDFIVLSPDNLYLLK